VARTERGIPTSRKTIVNIIEFAPNRDHLAYTFGGKAPIMTVQPGDVLKLWSEDAFNHALTSVDDL
jgi:hypothetical protein